MTCVNSTVSFNSVFMPKEFQRMIFFPFCLTYKHDTIENKCIIFLFLVFMQTQIFFLHPVIIIFFLFPILLHAACTVLLSRYFRAECPNPIKTDSLPLVTIAALFSVPNEILFTLTTLVLLFEECTRQFLWTSPAFWRHRGSCRTLIPANWIGSPPHLFLFSDCATVCLPPVRLLSAVLLWEPSRRQSGPSSVQSRPRRRSNPLGRKCRTGVASFLTCILFYN